MADSNNRPTLHAQSALYYRDNISPSESKIKSAHSMSMKDIIGRDIPYAKLPTNADENVTNFPNMIKKYDKVLLTVIPGSNNQSYYIVDNGTVVQGWISPRDVLHPTTGAVSSGYTAALYDSTDKKIFQSQSFVIDYYSGVVTFDVGTKPAGDIKVTCYVYIGEKANNLFMKKEEIDSLFANKSTLDKIGELNGNPTWNGSEWPGGSGSSDTGEKFKTIRVSGQSDIVADNQNDILYIIPGTGISITSNPDADSLRIDTTGSFYPSAHATSHINNGSDPIPNAVANSTSGLMSGADKAKLDSIPSGMKSFNKITSMASTSLGHADQGSINAGLTQSTLLVDAGRGIDILTDDVNKKLTISMIPKSLEPASHASSHEKDGEDPITINKLSGSLSREQHGNLPGGLLHSEASISTNGFMSSFDKNKLDSSTPLSNPNTLVQRDNKSNITVNKLTSTFTISDIMASKIKLNSNLINSFLYVENYTKLNSLDTTIFGSEEVIYRVGDCSDDPTYSAGTSKTAEYKWSPYLNKWKKLDSTITWPYYNNQLLENDISPDDFLVNYSYVESRLGELKKSLQDFMTNKTSWKYQVKAATSATIDFNIMNDYPYTYTREEFSIEIGEKDSLFLKLCLVGKSNGRLVIDGIGINYRDRVLIKDFVSNPAYNGIYTVIDEGSPIRPCVLIRSKDSTDLTPKIAVFVKEGVTYAGVGFILETLDPITMNTTPLSFIPFTGVYSITPGSGLYRSGRNLNVGGASGRIEIFDDNIDLAEACSTPGTFTKVTVDKYGRVTTGSQISNSDITGIDASKINSGVISINRLPIGIDPGMIAPGGDYVSKTGAIMTGALILSEDPTDSRGAATKQYVDSRIGTVDIIAGEGLLRNDKTIDLNLSGGQLEIFEHKLSLSKTSELGGTGTKVTYDAYGRIISKSLLLESDIPELHANKITAGIFSTDRLPMSSLALANHIHDGYLQTIGGTLTGNIQLDTGIKIFTQSDVYNPTYNNELVNKKYVDDKVVSGFTAGHGINKTNDVVSAVGVSGRISVGLDGIDLSPIHSETKTYTKCYVDNYGRVYGGSVTLNANDITSGVFSSDRLPIDTSNGSSNLLSRSDHGHSNYLQLSGGTMTGLIMSPDINPTNDLHIVNKKYVDNKVASGVVAGNSLSYTGTTLNVLGSPRIISNPSGLDLVATLSDLTPNYENNIGTFTKVTVDKYGRIVATTNINADDIPNIPASKINTGKISTTVLPINEGGIAPFSHSHGNSQITDLDWTKLTNVPSLITENGGGNIAQPVTISYVPNQDNQIVNKGYVDSLAQGLTIKESVKVVSTTNIDGNYISNTITLNSNGSLVIDGVILDLNDRVLLIGQTDKKANGIYYVYDKGSSETPAILRRSKDFDQDNDVKSGCYVFVKDGASYADKSFILITNDPITLGETNLDFILFTTVGSISAGNGLVQNGQSFDIVGSNNRIQVNENNIDISENYMGQTSINTVGVITTGVWNGTKIDNPNIVDGFIGKTYNGMSVTTGQDILTIQRGTTAFVVGGGKTITVKAADDTLIEFPVSQSGYVKLATDQIAIADGEVVGSGRPGLMSGADKKLLYSLSGGGTGGNSFGTINITGTSGQNPVVADSSNDTLILNAGTGIKITSSQEADSIDISLSHPDSQIYSFIAGSQIDDFDLVAINPSNGRLMKANSGNTNLSNRIIGVALTNNITKNAGDQVYICTRGKVSLPLEVFELDKFVYCGSNDGQLVQTIPTSGVITQIGIPLSENELYIDIKNSINIV